VPRTIVTYHLETSEPVAPAEALGPVLEQVRLADSLGYDGAWFAEHHFGGHRSIMPAPLLLAVYVAAQTRQLQAGTSVICLPLHHPVAVAEQVAVADVLSGGRMSIGFGSGSAPSDFAVFGSDQESRHARFEEQLAIVERCWSGEPFDFSGSYYQMRQVACVPRPLQEPARLAWIAASSEPTARLAGQLGFGLQLPRGRAPAAYVPLIAAYRQEWTSAGHPAGAERISIARCLYAGSSDDDAWLTAAEATRRFAQRWLPAAADLPGPELLGRLQFCVGGPTTVRRQLQELHQATGFTHLSMQPVWENLPAEAACASLRRFAEEVQPDLA
jgi:alkanesulfonate monooxygenase SsuD/methylene tetrahydromethanopterin reductase-like flavin-dependent oxidoreductase (luciferase family)